MCDPTGAAGGSSSSSNRRRPARSRAPLRSSSDGRGSSAMRYALAVAAFVGLTFASLSAQTSSAGAKRVETLEKGRKKVVLYDSSGAMLEMSEQVEEKDLPK